MAQDFELSAKVCAKPSASAVHTPKSSKSASTTGNFAESSILSASTSCATISSILSAFAASQPMLSSSKPDSKSHIQSMSARSSDTNSITSLFPASATISPAKSSRPTEHSLPRGSIEPRIPPKQPTDYATNLPPSESVAVSTDTKSYA